MRRRMVIAAVMVAAAVMIAGGVQWFGLSIASWLEAVTQPTVVVFAAGDIACDPIDANFNHGIGTPTACRQAATSNLLDANEAAILLLGDDQYECGGLSAFEASFNRSWGRFKSLIHPAPGNHEHQASRGSNCDATRHASGYFSYFGSAAHPENTGRYSFNLGSWHLIALDSNCGEVGGCGASSAEAEWLKADLAANRQPCILAYWHHPRWSSGRHGSGAQTDAFWRLLYAAHADIVLNGHDHDYERFAPQSPAGIGTPAGIREFVVGTGGRDHDQQQVLAANSQVRNFDTFGVLKLTLAPDSYAWTFVPVSGSTFTDSGTTSCH